VELVPLRSLGMIGALALALALAAAQPSAPPDGVERLACRVVTVSGATLQFPVEVKGDPDTGEARIPKPSAAFVPASEERKFLIRDLPTNLFLDLFKLAGSPGHYVTTLFLEVDGRSGFPVAGGYCLPAGAKAATAVATNFGALTDEALVKAADDHQPCFLVTPMGRVSRFETYVVPRGREQDRVFEPLDRIIWSARRTSPETGLPPAPPTGVIPVQFWSILPTPKTSPSPNGLSMGYIEPERDLAVGTLQFIELGAGGAPGDDQAFGICAIRLQRGE
jgi:hypothetical protein